MASKNTKMAARRRASGCPAEIDVGDAKVAKMSGAARRRSLCDHYAFSAPADLPFLEIAAPSPPSMKCCLCDLPEEAPGSFLCHLHAGQGMSGELVSIASYSKPKQPIDLKDSQEEPQKPSVTQSTSRLGKNQLTKDGSGMLAKDGIQMLRKLNRRASVTEMGMHVNPTKVASADDAPQVPPLRRMNRRASLTDFPMYANTNKASEATSLCDVEDESNGAKMALAPVVSEPIAE
eukprot:2497999-Rhodomonas_salina.1